MPKKGSLKHFFFLVLQKGKLTLFQDSMTITLDGFDSLVINARFFTRWFVYIRNFTVWLTLT